MNPQLTHELCSCGHMGGHSPTQNAHAIQEAVIHFTGSFADIEKLEGSGSIYGVHSADGYYIGIGA